MPNNSEADEAIKALENLVKNLPKELAIISGKTARKGRSLIAKAVTEELAVTQKVVKKHIRVKTDIERTGASIELRKSKRIGIQNFKARQTKAGVSYRISKTTGRTTATKAFMGPRPGVLAAKLYGGVFKREFPHQRLPIYNLRGPSPWGVLRHQHKKRKRITTELRAAYSKIAADRLRYQRLKQSGAI